jgi:moderate conductance mechanosensitive channel
MPVAAFAGLPARVLAAGNAAGLQKACGSPGNRTWLCETVYRITGSNGAADVADAVSKPARILLILVVAFVAVWLARRLVQRLARRLKAVPVPDTASAARRNQRAETTAGVIRSVVTIGIWTIALITILGELGVDLAPLLAGAGVAGVALGFGAQTVVRDFLAGTFMLLEDQFGVGDVIDVGLPAGTNTVYVAGVVEAVSLRVTQVRDVEGTLWFVPNGQMQRVGNKSQQWSRAVLDLSFAPTTSLDRAREVIETVGRELREAPEWHQRIPTDPEVWGIEALAGDHVVVRVVVRTVPLAQWDVAREFRARLKTAFEGAGLELAVTQLLTGRRPEPAANGNEQAAR